MTISNFRAAEALYIVIVRHKDAENLLKQWVDQHTRISVQIESNRMKIFDSQSLSVFQMDWAHSWEQVTIWDCWNKRHIEV